MSTKQVIEVDDVKIIVTEDEIIKVIETSDDKVIHVTDGPQGTAGADGEQGEDGADGKTWHSGEGAPDIDLGNSGDYYLDYTTGDVWHKVGEGGGWDLEANIKGADGAEGPQGEIGPEGPQGPIGDSQWTIADTTLSPVTAGTSVAIGTGAFTGATFNGVALTTAGAGTDFLANDGTYKTVSQYWSRTETTLSTATAGDSVTIGGTLKVGDSTYFLTVSRSTSFLNIDTEGADAKIDIRRAGTSRMVFSGSQVEVGSSTVFKVANTTSSTSTITGCATFAGGVGIAGRIFSGDGYTATSADDMDSDLIVFKNNGAAINIKGFSWKRPDDTITFDAYVLDYLGSNISFQIYDNIRAISAMNLNSNAQRVTFGYDVRATTTTASTSKTTGSLQAVGGMAVGTNLWVGTHTTIDGMAAPAVSADGKARLYMDSSSNTVKVSQNGGAYVNIIQDLSGYAPLAGATFTGAVHVNNATASTSTTTGALKVAGGVGVVGAVTVGGQAYSTGKTLAYGTTINTDLDQGNVNIVILTGNATLANPSNQKSGSTYIWIIKQDGTGSRTLAYGSAFKFPLAIAPVLSTKLNYVDILTGVSDGTNIYCNLINDFR